MSKSLLEIVNSFPSYAKEAREHLYKGKVYVVGTSFGSIYKFVKTKRGAEGYIKKQSRNSYYDESTMEMTTCGSGLFFIEVDESEIVDPKTDKGIWYRALKERMGQHCLLNDLVWAAKSVGVTEEIMLYVETSIDGIKKNEGLLVLKEYEEEEEHPAIEAESFTEDLEGSDTESPEVQATPENNVVSFDDFSKKRAEKIMNQLTGEQKLKLYALHIMLGEKETAKHFIEMEFDVDKLFSFVATSTEMFSQGKEE